MIRLLILGATGSIGSTCLNALRKNTYDIKLVGLSANYNKEKLLSLKEEFNAPILLTQGNITSSKLDSFIDETQPDIVLNAISGFDGLFATKTILEKGIDIALANKESVVSGGSFIFDLARKNNCEIIPVDSEHSAIYDLLKNRKADKLLITASGGPFVDREDLSSVTVEDALKHPTWKMGRKITLDSASLANKGLEVIEASYLFSFDPKKISVVVHRQSIVHSMIETIDGAVYAVMSPPDMTLPIMSAISKGREENKNIVRPLSFDDLTLTFEKPDRKRFPLLEYAYSALELGYSGPVIYNAADEIAAYGFLDKKIPFTAISDIVLSALEQKDLVSLTPSTYENVLLLDKKTRLYAMNIIKEKRWGL